MDDAHATATLDVGGSVESYKWDGGGGANTSWLEPTNWSDDTVPDINDIAVFPDPSAGGPKAIQLDFGLDAWNDPDVGVEWPLADPLLSDRDRRHETLKQHAPNSLPRLTVDP